MKLEELIAALNQSNIDMNAQEEIIERLGLHERLEDERATRIIGRASAYENGYANGLRDGRPQSDYFTILETHKEDMKSRFDDKLHTLAAIDRLTDDQMGEIVRDVGNQLVEHYWEALELAVKAELEEGK